MAVQMWQIRQFFFKAIATVIEIIKAADVIVNQLYEKASFVLA